MFDSYVICQIIQLPQNTITHTLLLGYNEAKYKFIIMATTFETSHRLFTARCCLASLWLMTTTFEISQ